MDGKDYIIKVKNVLCQYPNEEAEALEIETLNIERGKIYFFIGESGVGKSTALEALGLMNNIIKPKADVKDFEFQYHINPKPDDAFDLWHSNWKGVAQFRKNHLSFIFQNTNMLNTISAFQNAYIGRVLQGDNLENSRNKATKMLRKIFINQETTHTNEEMEATVNRITNTRARASQLSGGQRQRLAFARAMILDYDILFADEPTGNLDDTNAHNLMKQLREHLKDDNQTRTAIIVSHSRELAETYGDRIVMLGKKEADRNGKIYRFGLINEESVYSRSQDPDAPGWVNEVNGKPLPPGPKSYGQRREMELDLNLN